MLVEGELDQVLHADRHVDQDFQRERCLSQGERAEVEALIATALLGRKLPGSSLRRCSTTGSSN